MFSKVLFSTIGHRTASRIALAIGLTTAAISLDASAQSGSGHSREYFIPASQCQTIDLEGICDDDGGTGCEIFVTLFNTGTDEVRGYEASARMSSLTLQGNDGSRRITLGNAAVPILSSTVLGKGAVGVTLFSPWNLMTLQNSPTGCPMTYLPPQQTGPTYSNRNYVSTTKLTARASKNWNVTVLVKKIAD